MPVPPDEPTRPVNRISGCRRKLMQATPWLPTVCRLIATAVFSLGTALSGDANAAANKILIGVAQVPHSLPFFVAEQEGFLAQEAPNVQLVKCFPGRKCLDQLLAGTVQFATAADTPVINASFMRADFMVVATIASSSSDIHLVGSKAAGVLATRQLIGKKVGVIKGTSTDYFLDSVLIFDGIDPAQVEKVDIAPDRMAAALRQNQIDGFALFDPGFSQAVESLGDLVTLLKTPPIYLATFNLIGMRTSIGKNDADMVKVLRALDRANLFIQRHPDAVHRILSQRLHMSEASAKLVSKQLDYALSLDQTFIKTLEGEARWYSQQRGNVGIKPANYLDYIYPLPLRQVRPQAVTIVK